MGVILVADIGTTILKAGLCGLDGRLTATVRKALPQPVDDMADSADWLRAFAEAVRELGASAVDAVIVSGNGPTMVSSEGGKALLWMHRAATAQCAEVQARAGVHSDPSFFVPKAMYIRDNHPSLYGRTKAFLSTPEFVSYRLCGQAATFMCLDGLEALYWNNDILDAMSLDRSKFPPFVKAGTMLGRVTAEGSAWSGIAQGVPVISGCPDFMAAIVGSGAMHAGQICDRSGTSQGVNLCLSAQPGEPMPPDLGGLLRYRHPNGRDWNVSGLISNSGSAIAFARHLYGSDDFSYPEFYSMLERTTRPGSGGVVFLPYLSGERAPIWNSSAKGSFTGISLYSTREQMLRAVCEGVCFSMKHVIESMPGSKSEIRATGGPSESAFINQMKADITGLRVVVPEHREAGLAGLGIIACDALSGTHDLQATADRLIRVRAQFEPNPDNREVYESTFAKYRQTYEALKPTYCQY